MNKISFQSYIKGRSPVAAPGRRLSPALALFSASLATAGVTTANGTAPEDGGATPAANVGSAYGANLSPTDPLTFTLLGSTGSGGFSLISGISTPSASAGQTDLSGYAAGLHAIAIGNTSTRSAGSDSVAVGNGAQALGTFSGAFGAYAYAAKDYSYALGRSADALGVGSLAIGFSATAAKDYATALGYVANAGGTNATALGYSSSAGGDESAALGKGANAGGLSATALGSNATAPGDYAAAIGYVSRAKGSHSLAFGYSAVADATDAISIGEGANVAETTGLYSTAIGYYANVAGAYANALGYQANASADNAVAIGGYAAASGVSSLALGYGSIADGVNSVALGSGSNTGGVDNVVSVGAAGSERKIVNVAAGTLGTTSTDAVNGSQLYAVSQSITSISNTGVSDYFHVSSSGSASQATGTNSVAIGSGANAQSTDSIAIGTGANASGGKAVAIGSGMTAQGNGAVSIGDPGTTIGDGAVGVGNGNNAYGQGAIAGGYQNTANAVATPANGTVALGSANTATGEGAVALGNANTATGAGAVAIGDSSNARYAGSVALGASSTTSASLAALQAQVAYNPGSGTLSGTTPVGEVSLGAIGAERRLTNVAAGAAGTDAVNVSQLKAVATAGSNLDSTAVKYTWTDTNANGVVDSGEVNYNVVTLAGGASGTTITNVAAGVNPTDAVNFQQLNSVISSGVAVRYFVQNETGLTASQAYAVGTGSLAAGYEAGKNGNAANTYNTAVGATSGQNVTGSNNVALGVNAGNGITADDTVSVGSGAQAQASNSVALGAGSIATEANTVSVGSTGNERRITNVAAGVNPTDAVNLSQLNGVTGNVSALTSQVADIDTHVTAVDNRAKNIGTSTAANLGGNAAYNATTGTISAPSYTVAGGSYNNVGSALSALDGRDTAQQSQIDGNTSRLKLLETWQGETNNRIGELQNGIDATGSMAAAMTQVQPKLSDKLRNQLSAGIGFYRDSTAVALGFSHIAATADKAATVSISVSDRGDLMGGGGVTIGW